MVEEERAATTVVSHAARLGALPIHAALSWFPNLLELRLRYDPACSPPLMGDAFGACSSLGALEVLDLRSQPHVNGHTLRGLSPHVPRLRCIDASFCPGIGYAAACALRTVCPLLSLVRRVPISHTGWFVLPALGRAGSSKVMHLWADGSFALDGSLAFGERQELGWIAQLRQHTGAAAGPAGGIASDVCDAVLETRTCFCDEEPAGAPDNGRIGVMMRRVRDDVAAQATDSDAHEEASIVALVRATPNPLATSTAAPAAAAPATPTAEPEALGAVEALPLPSEGTLREMLVVQSTRLPEPPRAFPALPRASWPALGQRVRGSRLGPPYQGLSIARLAMHPLPPTAQMPPAAVAERLLCFCRQHPAARREYEERALASMRDARGGAQRVAAVARALAPGDLGAATAHIALAAQAAWEDLSSSESDDDDDD